MQSIWASCNDCGLSVNQFGPGANQSEPKDSDNCSDCEPGKPDNCDPGPNCNSLQIIFGVFTCNSLQLSVLY